MEEISGIMVSVLISCWLLLATIANYAIRNDNTVETYVNTTVHEFVDTARTTGKVTASDYDQLIKKLDATGNVYDINIEARNERQYPTMNGNEVTGYETGYEVDGTNSIMDTLYGTQEEQGNDAEGVYRLENGDYFKVEVKNRSATLGNKLLSSIYFRVPETGTVYVSYGGYVGNDAES